ncbi:MAG: hypothetical protein ACRCWQ_02700 [Bacilli bacterium]
MLSEITLAIWLVANIIMTFGVVVWIIADDVTSWDVFQGIIITAFVWLCWYLAINI